MFSLCRLEVRFKHNRKSGDNDEYDYKITLCGKKNGDKAATQKETSSTTSKVQTHVIAKHTNRSLLIGGGEISFLIFFFLLKLQPFFIGMY